jgi:hypothetical protein
MSTAMTEPSATGKIAVNASPERIYALVSDPGALAGLAEEYTGHRWLGGATKAAVGVRFRGGNKNGFRRWSTLSTITDAEEGARFAFDVRSFGQPVARWQYDIEPNAEGAVVTESTWELRSSWFKVVSQLATGVWRRDEANQANIETTLRRLRAQAEA